MFPPKWRHITKSEDTDKYLGTSMTYITSEVFILTIFYLSRLKSSYLFWFDDFSHETTIVTLKNNTLIISSIFLFIRWKNESLCFSKDPLRNLKIHFGVKDILKYSFFFFFWISVFGCDWRGKNQKAVRGDLDIWLRWDHGYLTIFSYLVYQNSYKFKKINISTIVKNI